MEHFENFVQTMCIVDPNEKIQSSKLLNGFRHYLKNLNPPLKISNSNFTRGLKEKYESIYPHVKEYDANYFHGLTLMDTTITGTHHGRRKLTTEEKIESKRITNRKYNEKVSSRKKFEQQYDEILKTKLKVSDYKFGVIKRLGLIKYIIVDGSLDVDNTVESCLRSCNEYNQKGLPIDIDIIQTND